MQQRQRSQRDASNNSSLTRATTPVQHQLQCGPAEVVEGDFANLAAGGKFTKEGDFVEEGNFAKDGAFAKEGVSTEDGNFAQNGDFTEDGICQGQQLCQGLHFAKKATLP